jgi:hypothetical protein
VREENSAETNKIWVKLVADIEPDASVAFCPDTNVKLAGEQCGG